MHRISRKLIAVSVTALVATVAASTAIAAPYDHGKGHHRDKAPVRVTVFSPGADDHSGAAGVGFIVDLALDANNARGNALLSPAAGYKPFFNAPVTAAGLPDPIQVPTWALPVWLCWLSSTPTKPGTPFMGPRTNLAGLFQINGVARVHGLAETWNTWQPQKPLFGLNQSARLTVYVVAGTAPTLVPDHGPKIISAIIHVPFVIAR